MQPEARSVRAIERIVTGLLEAGQLNQALKVIHEFVTQIVTEPLCTAQVFGSATLDALCQRIGRISLEKLNATELAATVSPDTQYVYVVTKLQNSGGHRQVILDFIHARPHAEHVILSTELDGASDMRHLNAVFASNAAVRFELAPATDMQGRLIWLQQRLLKLKPTRTYLFNHHQDSVAVAAIQPSMMLEASFYHHGDHHMCLGVHLRHLDHIDPHPMGYFNCRDHLKIRNVYIPLTMTDKGGRQPDVPWLADGFPVTCTAARANKVEIPYFISYIEFIPKLLKATGGRHVHIGRLTPWALWRIRHGLRLHGISSEKFVYVAWVPSIWEALHSHRVDLYVASFPYGGGLTLIEAMGAGIPVALHRHMYSKLLSCLELGYPDAFSWRQPEDLLHYCQTLTPAKLQEASQAGRDHFEKYHRSELLQHILNNSERHGIEPVRIDADFSVATDEWAAWMTSQLNASRLVYQGVYRAFKRLRSIWS